ncbi:putative ATP-dependent DNA helicase Q1 [Mercenaria mercenaria]|uniref:putative ATP-dependent DNA helicase Q1 n=1 Tax=Mercenaria mercenaria TaxID=6596 RepID=UPI00234F6453|nr:putative ATP-dependent DNA helicase Q1 [Mercenaria mercenaria]
MDDLQIITSTSEKFGFKLKDAQIECLCHVLKKEDCMAILPTGYGKSLIYQLAPHVLMSKYGLEKSVCLILTPLNSIMQDQILSLQKLGISACAVDYTCSTAQTTDSDQDDDDDDGDDDERDCNLLIDVPIENVSKGGYSLIYAHPEALLSTKAGEQLLRKFELDNTLSCVAVDEAHMILEWGKDFRTDFTIIGTNLLARFPEIPVMVFTATASAEAQSKIAKSLQMKSPNVISRNPDRVNIKYSKIFRPPSAETQDHLDEILAPMVDSLIDMRQNYPLTLIYTDTSTISYAYTFFEKKMGDKQYMGEAIPENRLFAQYHQTYTEKMKKFIVSELCKEQSVIRVVFATVALGMGLNSPHVRNVIHYKSPTSIEKYFQETGRAGRDGKPSSATLYYNNTDIRKNRPGIENSIIHYCKNNSKCMREMMLEHFGHMPSEMVDRSSCCDFCDTL